MLPLNSLSSKTIQSRFLYPSGIIVGNITEDFELGGIALQDPSKGLMYQPWYGYWNEEDSTVYLVPNFVSIPIPIFTETNVFEFSFAFDQNMRWAAFVLLKDGTGKFRWYDSQAGAYVTTIYTGVTGFKLSLDDKRAIQITLGLSDLLLTYIKDNKLYVRSQRDRFGIEYLLQSDLPNNLLITNFGMNERLRMQWRLRYRRPGDLLPWLL